MNSDDLMGLFRAGDRDAFNTIFNRFFKPISLFARQITQNTEEGEDIAINSFFKLWKIHKNFETEVNIKAFLYITTKNACLDFLKQENRKKTSYRDWANFSENWEPDYLQAAIEAEIFHQIREEVDKLPPDCKNVFKMLVYEGRKPAEVAALLNIDIRTVASHKSNALKTLRQGSLRDRLLLILFLLTCMASQLRKFF